MINAGAVRVPEGAGFNPGLEITVAPQLTKFQNAITTHQAGYVYVWVSNESENTKVWFDDLKVTHRSSRVTQATDYYAWGNVMRENKSPEDVRYRYGYQGQFAEKDEETGWNHFELREYDAVIGRWLVVDPYRQYWSPYVGMGNNTVSGIDKDGGFKTKFQAQWFAFWNGGGDIMQSTVGDRAGEWFVGKQVNLEGGGIGIQYNRIFEGESTLELKVKFDLSFGVQFGEHLTSLQGFDFNLASMTLYEMEMSLRYDPTNGLKAGSEILSHIRDPRIKQGIFFDGPGAGGSLQHTFMANDDFETGDRWFNVHAGYPFLGLNSERHWDRRGNTRDDTFIGGSLGGRFGIGGDLEYGLRLINK
jgi:RHS repeat-associated protein